MKVEMSMDLIDSLAQLRRAIEDEGPMPEYHRHTMERQRAEWPRLWSALDLVMRATALPQTGVRSGVEAPHKD